MTNNKQQTAVEWFAKQMEILHYDYWAEHISKDEKNQRLKQLKEQAKEMDKEEMVMFVLNVIGKYRHGDVLAEVATELYEQTYGDEDKQ
jgi:hypothetical protein